MLISDNPRFGRRTQEMLRLVPLDKEKNEESKVEDVASPVLFTARFFFVVVVCFLSIFS